MPDPFGPVSAIRSGPRAMSSASGSAASAFSPCPSPCPSPFSSRSRSPSSRTASAGRHGSHEPSRPRTVSTVRPAGTAVPGSEILMASSSRTASSASASRVRASATRSAWTSRDRPALSSAARLRALATIVGMLPEAASFRPCRSRPACLVWLSVTARGAAPDVGVGRADRAPGGGLLDLEHVLVGGQVPAVQAQRVAVVVAAQVRDLVHQGEQFAVVAHDQHDTGPGLDRRVEPPPRRQVEVVGRLVEQQHRRASQEQRRSARS